MDAIIMHTAARRFCESQYSRWTSLYSELDGAGRTRVSNKGESTWRYSDEALALFPRYRLDGAMLVGIERLVPERFRTVDEMRTAIQSAGHRGFQNLSSELNLEGATAALESEHATFSEYISSLDEDALRQIEALPYRRVLSEDESNQIWATLKSRWGIAGRGYGWFPLDGGEPPQDAIAFHEELWNARNGTSILIRALSERRIAHCFLVRELGEPEYEIECKSLDPSYSGSESFITTDGEWLLYVSHESSVTVAGWLADVFLREWADALNVTYGGPFHTDDLRGTWNSEV